MHDKTYQPSFPVLFGLLLAIICSPALATETHPGEHEFAREVAQRHENVTAGDIVAILDQAERKQSILDAISRPAESKPWQDYQPIFLTPARIAGGVAFYKQNEAMLERIADKHGVDPEYIVAILGIETNYGLITGNYRVIDALVTLAFYYPSRADFFRSELERLLTMPQQQLPGPVTDITGSYAGAMGWGQFMPSSIAAYARDEDGDQHIDLMRSLPDILGSVANYLAAHGWESGEPVAVRAQAADNMQSVYVNDSKAIHSVGELAAWGYTPVHPLASDVPATLLRLDGDDGVEYWITFENFYVITRYNHSSLYAMAVHQLASAIASGIGDRVAPAR